MMTTVPPDFFGLPTGEDKAIETKPAAAPVNY
jgi:hypothetical protein